MSPRQREKQRSTSYEEAANPNKNIKIMSLAVNQLKRGKCIWSQRTRASILIPLACTGLLLLHLVVFNSGPIENVTARRRMNTWNNKAMVADTDYLNIVSGARASNGCITCTSNGTNATSEDSFVDSSNKTAPEVVPHAELIVSTSTGSGEKTKAKDEGESNLTAAVELPRADNLKLAMLLSFPNSGTSFTLSTVRRASQHHVGSTACLEKRKTHYFTPVFSSIPQHGPHFTPISSSAKRRLSRPKEYILTKTHCDGYDNSPTPTPWKYIISQDKFKEGCRKVCSPLPSYIQPDHESKWDFFLFDEALIGSFVHLFRDPFDNIISRWHNHMKAAKWKYPDEVGKWNTTASGFQAFCRERDEYHRKHEAPYLPQALVNASEGVPCKTDFVRYIQWHNHAFTMTENLNKPVHILHYVDYRDDYNVTILKLLSFLELPFAADGDDFQWRDYADYFTPEQRNATKYFIKKFAYPEFLHELGRYGFE